MKFCITYPQFILAHWKARRAFVNYPLYDVPNKKPERKLGEKKVQENFDYFMRVKDERLSFLIDWLQCKFSLSVSLTPEGACALNNWIDKYSGGLIEDRSKTDFAFERYRYPWEGPFGVCNLAMDVGIFIGEYCIKKYPFLRWEIYRGHEIEISSFKSSAYKRPVLSNFPEGQVGHYSLDALNIIIDAFNRSHLIYPQHEISAPNGALIRRLQGALYSARRNPNRPVPQEDTSHEPL